jgi:hypothetical protein
MGMVIDAQDEGIGIKLQDSCAFNNAYSDRGRKEKKKPSHFVGDTLNG